MKTFIRRAALFGAGLGGVLVLAAVYYEARVRQPDDFFRQVEWFNDPAVKPVVLLIGDSRMATNIDPRRLPPGFYNFSFPGETLPQLYLRAKYALETKPTIRYLVIGLEDVTLSDARWRVRDVSRQMLFANFSDIAEVYPGQPRLLLRNALLHYLPLINATQRRRAADTLVDDVVGLFAERPPSSPARLLCGGFELTLDRDPRDANGKKSMAEEVKALFGRSTNVAEMRAVFRKLLVLAADYGVEVIGVRSPVSRPYLSAAVLHDIDTPFTFFKRSSLSKMLDYQAAYADEAAYFYNGDHLNRLGAARYTDKLVRDLRRLVRVERPTPAPCDVVTTATLSWPYNNIFAARPQLPSCREGRDDCEPDSKPDATIIVDHEEPEPEDGTAHPVAEQSRSEPGARRRRHPLLPLGFGSDDRSESETEPR